MPPRRAPLTPLWLEIWGYVALAWAGLPDFAAVPATFPAPPRPTCEADRHELQCRSPDEMASALHYTGTVQLNGEECALCVCVYVYVCLYVCCMYVYDRRCAYLTHPQRLGDALRLETAVVRRFSV